MNRRGPISHRPHLRRLNAALCLAVAAYSLGSNAQEIQYRWENEQGEVIYSDRPPPAGIEYELTDTHPGLHYAEPDAPPQDAPPQEETATEAGENVADTAGTNPQGNASTEEGDNQKNPGLCEKARMNLIVLENESDLTVRNEEGQARTLSPEDVAFALENARRQIKLYCE